MKRNLFFTCLIIVLVSALAESVMADDVTLYKIQNRWLGTQFLNDANAKINYGAGNDDTYLWSIEDHGGFQRIKNKATGNYLAVKSGTTDLESKADAGPSDATADWGIDVVSGSWNALQSISTRKYISVEFKLGYAACDMTETPSDSSRWSEQWNLVYVSGPPAPHRYARNRVSVTSPPYCSDVTGDTTLYFVAPGLTGVVVKCWQQGEGFGADSTVGAVQLDAACKGSIVFPADKYPHGPITVN